jgi:hypothetical protein
MPLHKDVFHGYFNVKAAFDLRAGHSLPPKLVVYLPALGSLPSRQSRGVEFIIQHSFRWTPWRTLFFRPTKLWTKEGPPPDHHVLRRS